MKQIIKVKVPVLNYPTKKEVPVMITSLQLLKGKFACSMRSRIRN
jgi:hypothetical protein